MDSVSVPDLAREPLVKRAVVAGSVHLLSALVSSSTRRTCDERSSKIVDAICVAAPIAAWTWAVLTSRAKVTPVERPTDYVGNTLVPAGLRLDVGDTDELLDTEEPLDNPQHS
jgi:hypothetical protein